MNRRLVNRGRAAATALALALLSAACGGATSSPATGSATSASATVAPTATPDSLPTAVASGSDMVSGSDAASPEPAGSAAPSGEDGEALDLCATDQQPCPIEPGTYTTRPFEPEFTFTVGEGWSSDRVFKDGGQISKGEASFVWASSVEAGAVAGVEVEIEPGVTGFLAHLARFEGFDVSSPANVTIDGVTGSMVDVTTNDVDASGIYFVEADRMNLAPGEKARFFVLDKDGDTVILIIDAWYEDDFDSFLAEAQPIVDSIRWR